MSTIFYDGTPVAVYSAIAGTSAQSAPGLEATLAASPVWQYLFLVDSPTQLAQGTYDIVIAEPTATGVSIVGGGSYPTLAAAAADLGWALVGGGYLAPAGTVVGSGIVKLLDASVDAALWSVV